MPNKEAIDLFNILQSNPERAKDVNWDLLVEENPGLNFNTIREDFGQYLPEAPGDADVKWFLAHPLHRVPKQTALGWLKGDMRKGWERFKGQLAKFEDVEIPKGTVGISERERVMGNWGIGALKAAAGLPVFVEELLGIAKPLSVLNIKEADIKAESMLKGFLDSAAKAAALTKSRIESRERPPTKIEKEMFGDVTGKEAFAVTLPALLAIGGPKAARRLGKYVKEAGRRIAPTEFQRLPKLEGVEGEFVKVGDKPSRVFHKDPQQGWQEYSSKESASGTLATDLNTYVESVTPKKAPTVKPPKPIVPPVTTQKESASARIGKLTKEKEAGFYALDEIYADLLEQKGKAKTFKQREILDQQMRDIGKQKLKFLTGEAGKVLNPFNEIAKTTSKMIEKTKVQPEIKAGVKEAKEAMIEHDRQIRAAEFTSKQFEHVISKNVPKDRQMMMVHAYEHKMGGEHWHKLTPKEKEIVRWAGKEKDKLNQFIKDNNVLEMMPEQKGINHIFHHWIDPKTGKPYDAMYSKFSKGLPQAKQRTISTYESGIEAGMKPATNNLGKLIGLEWESVMRAHQSRQMFKSLHNIGADPKTSIQLVPGKDPKPIRMVESWNKLEDQGLTDSYTPYDHWALRKPMTFKSGDRLVTIQGTVGVRKELFPFVKAYLENPNYTMLDRLNFASKSLKLGFSAFHIVSLAAQEVANWRVPFKNIPRGLRLAKKADPNLRLLYEEGLDLWKGYEDIGYQNRFLTGTSRISQLGNTVTKPIELMRSAIFDVIQPGMKASFAYDKYHKGLAKATKEGLTERQWAREVVKMADGHFSHEHWKRSLLETNRWMVKMYFEPGSRRAWQRLLLSPTWQREHLLVAKNVAKSFMPDKLIRKLGMEDISKTAKREYQKYFLGALTMIAAADLYNLMATKEMDGTARHLWQNPPGKGFAVRALWDEPAYTVETKGGKTRKVEGGPGYFRPLKSVFEVAEWGRDPIKKFGYKISPSIQAIGQQIWPSKYQADYEDLGDIPRRVLDVGLTVGSPIQAHQVAQVLRGKKSIPSGILPFFGMPTSKFKIKAYYNKIYNEALDEKNTKEARSILTEAMKQGVAVKRR